MLLLLFSIALTARRLIDRRAYPLAIVALFFAGSALGMFMPNRIHHHGWQLALLALTIAGVSDLKAARGGATVGFATALSLTIGLEMLIYLALAGVATVLFWVADPAERRRVSAYAVTLGGGTAFGFLVFASYANRLPACDALSPVWLSDALLAAGLMYGLSLLTPGRWSTRLGLAIMAGLVIAAFHALMWPACLSRLEASSPEVEKLWLSHVREARPIYRHGWKVEVAIAAIPVTGMIGWALLAWTPSRGPGVASTNYRRGPSRGFPRLPAVVADSHWPGRAAYGPGRRRGVDMDGRSMGPALKAASLQNLRNGPARGNRLWRGGAGGEYILSSRA